MATVDITLKSPNLSDSSSGKAGKPSTVAVNLYDKAHVLLTTKSAKYLNKINAEANYFMMCTFREPVLLRADYLEGDYFCSDLITISELHLKMQEQGIEHGFYGDVVTVEI